MWTSIKHPADRSAAEPNHLAHVYFSVTFARASRSAVTVNVIVLKSAENPEVAGVPLNNTSYWSLTGRQRNGSDVTLSPIV